MSTCVHGHLVVVRLPVLERRSLGRGDPKLSLLCLWGQSSIRFNFNFLASLEISISRLLYSTRLSFCLKNTRVSCPLLVTLDSTSYRHYGMPRSIRLLLQSVTTKRNHLFSHGHKGECPMGEKAYKILYPLGGRPTPSGCTGVGQSEERDPSNITLYG